MKKGIFVVFGGILGFVLFLISNYFNFNFLYGFFNTFSFGLGQDKFITKGFIALGLSVVSWILIGGIVGWIYGKKK